MSACLAYDLPLSDLNVTACVPCLLRIHFIRFGMSDYQFYALNMQK